ncbi:MAG: hypothetical protein PF572_04090 [Patescibacteria group bacterium]|jgi:hypothetical protein|nr:hypothetical protein [Patescibacteria group bacterium]
MKKYLIYIAISLLPLLVVFIVFNKKMSGDINSKWSRSELKGDVKEKESKEFLEIVDIHKDSNLVELTTGEESHKAVKEIEITYEQDEKRKIADLGGLIVYLAFKELNCNNIRNWFYDLDLRENYEIEKINYCKDVFKKESINVNDFDVVVEKKNISLEIPRCGNYEIGNPDLYEGAKEKFDHSDLYEKISIYLGNNTNELTKYWYIIKNTQNITNEDIKIISNCEGYYFNWLKPPILVGDYVIIESREPGTGISSCWGINPDSTYIQEGLVKCVIKEDESKNIKLLIE